MSESSTAPAGSPGEPSGEAATGGFIQNFLDLYVSPREAFERICRKPGFPPAALLIVVSAAATAVWLHNVDARDFTQQQMDQFGGKFMQNMTPEQRRESIDMQTKALPFNKWLGVALGRPFTLLAAAGVFWLVFRFFYAAEVRFAVSLAITSWTFLVVEIVSSALRLLVFWLKGVWEIDPNLVLQASPGAFVSSSAPKWLWAVASIPDLFTIWSIFLLATGFAVASRRTAGSTAWGIALPWLCLSFLGVGFVAIFL